jgi:ribosomal protein S18 acetylase RimI-like enzyme
MGQLKIRKATKKDAAVFAEFRYRMFSDMEPEKDFSKLKARFVRKSRDFYAGHLGRRDEYDCIAMMDGEVVGCGSIMFWERPPHIDHLENALGYILNIYVGKEFRKRGISRAIMEKLHGVARKRGMRKIGLHASHLGYPVYESMGYKPNGSYLELELT